MLALCLPALPAAAQEDRPAPFFAESGAGAPVFDQEALMADESLSAAEKAVIAHAVSGGRKDMDSLPPTAGVSARCSVDYHLDALPYHASCTVSATDLGSRNLADTGVGGAVGGVCRAVGEASFDALAPLCMAGLYLPMEKILMPMLSECVSRTTGTAIAIELRIDRPGDSVATADCT